MSSLRNLIHRTTVGLIILCILSLFAWGATAFTADPTAGSGSLHIASGGILITAPEIIFPKPTPPDGATTEQTA